MAEQTLYPINRDIELTQGVTARFIITWTKRDRENTDIILEYYNLDLYEILFSVRRSASDPTAIPVSTRTNPVVSVRNAAQGQFELDFSAFITADLPVLTEAQYDILMRDRVERDRTIHLFTGKFTVAPIAVKLDG